MSWRIAIALYLVIWWTILFAVLPFGVRSQAEEGEVVPGSEAGAPARPWLKRKIIATTILASIVLAIVWCVITYKLISL